jgi:predicted nucleotidyltransferase
MAKIKDKRVELKLKKIKDIIKLRLKPKKIILFGSRSKGNFSKGSDIDLCLIGAMYVDDRDIRKLKDEIDNISGLYSVDLLFWENVEDDFKKIIIETGEVIYEKK